MREHFLSKENFRDFIKELLNGGKVIAPVRFNDRNIIEEINESSIESINLTGFRAVEPFKSYIFKPIERVSSYFENDASPRPGKFVFLGARGCDLEALEVLDRVFLEGQFKDPFYAANRENIIIIGADCTDCGQTCFCTLVNGKPYPLKMFDLNLSPIDDGYLVEVGSDKGQRMVEENIGLFFEPLKPHQNEKAKLRQNVISRLAEVNNKFKLKLTHAEVHKLNLENPVWKTLTKDCVECSACNFICPTCSCFLLIDQKRDAGGERDKIWDACLKTGYTKVAGGANPRGRLFQRLQNRYQCKFDYSFDRLDRYTCVGCGRCINACAGNIDMRKIFVELEKQVPLTAKLV